jgi:hypothetical protein
MLNPRPPTQDERESHLEFFRIDEDTIDRMRRLKPRLMKYTRAALETIFEHLTTNPEVAHYFAIEENFAYLRDGMIAHCELVFSARFDQRYYDAVDQMGQRHAKLEYPSHAYTSGYANLISRITRLGMADRKAYTVDDQNTLTRIAFYDMELTMAAFYRHQMEKQLALTTDTDRLRDTMHKMPPAA